MSRNQLIICIYTVKDIRCSLQEIFHCMYSSNFHRLYFSTICQHFIKNFIARHIKNLCKFCKGLVLYWQMYSTKFFSTMVNVSYKVSTMAWWEYFHLIISQSFYVCLNIWHQLYTYSVVVYQYYLYVSLVFLTHYLILPIYVYQLLYF